MNACFLTRNIGHAPVSAARIGQPPPKEGSCYCDHEGVDGSLDSEAALEMEWFAICL
jgi:hypothetical protein